jgi:RNA polymerase sigma factor (sigma-70 family)
VAERNALVLSVTALVGRLVREWFERRPGLRWRYRPEDAFLDCQLALLRAAELWHAEGPASFAPYARQTVLKELWHASKLQNLIRRPLPRWDGHLSARYAQQRDARVSHDEQAINQTLDPCSFDPLQGLVARETRWRILRLLPLLPARQAEVLRLALEGLSWSEIARQLRVTKSAIHTLRNRAFRLLRQKIDPSILEE